MPLKIISSTNTNLLEKEAERYDISQLGSISVSNGQFFLTFIGELKVTEILKQVEETSVSKSTAKRVAAQKGK